MVLMFLLIIRCILKLIKNRIMSVLYEYQPLELKTFSSKNSLLKVLYDIM